MESAESSLGGALSVDVVAWKERAAVTTGRGWFKLRSLEISADLEKAIALYRGMGLLIDDGGIYLIFEGLGFMNGSNASVY